jgi:hypothetical protein
MKFLSALFLLSAAAFTGCSSTAGNNGVNGNAANMRGTNTNTGYVSNADSNAKPTVPANATNITPPNVNSVMGNGSANHASNNANTHSNSNSNMKKP